MVNSVEKIGEIASYSGCISRRILDTIEINDVDGVRIYSWCPEGVVDECVSQYTIKTTDLVKLVEFANKYYEYFNHQSEIDLMSDDERKSIVLAMTVANVAEQVNDSDFNKGRYKESWV